MKNLKYFCFLTIILWSMNMVHAQQNQNVRIKKNTPESSTQVNTATKAVHAEDAAKTNLPDTGQKTKRVKLSKKAQEKSMKEDKDARLHQTEQQNQNAERRPLPPQPASKAEAKPTGQQPAQGAEAKPTNPQPEKPAGIKVKNPKKEPINSKTGPKPKEKPVKQAKEEKAE